MTDHQQFESEVRRIARLLWPAAFDGGAAIADGQERDGVFETEEAVHLIECTVSRSKQKAVDDSKKLSTLAEKFRRSKSDKAIKCWFVTKEEPTADQRTVCQTAQGRVSAVSLREFQSRLINARDYLNLRGKHRFGSAYDPRTESFSENFAYVEIDLPQRGGTKQWTVKDLADALAQPQSGHRFCLLGDYGVGKSMTLRELFTRLSQRYSQGSSQQIFPVYLNLREHHGQDDPAEILERHARTIGFQHPVHLVRAWKAGYVILLLDGFDEVSSLGLQGGWRRLRHARRTSMAGVRRLIADSPKSAGIVIAGRDTFFDSDAERRECLGTETWTEILLGEFSEPQIEKFLNALGFSGTIPPWIPSRPLLLGTLFSKGVRGASERSGEDLASLLECNSSSAGWDMLLEELCKREAKIEAGLSGTDIRDLLEALATRARSKEGGLGPLNVRELTESFQAIVGIEPSDQALTVLQRLPGMGRYVSSEGDCRTFIDAELADACRAGDIVKYSRDPYSFGRSASLCEARAPIGETGRGISADRLKDILNEGTLRGLVREASRHGHNGVLLADVVLLARRLGVRCSEPVTIANVTFDSLNLSGEEAGLTHTEFNQCFFGRIELDSGTSTDAMPRFTGCLIQEIDGRVSMDDLPKDRFIECDIEVFLEGTLSNEAISRMPVPEGVKALLSVLKKLFVQSLSGRQEGALFRGLDGKLRPLVPKVLELIRQHNVSTKSERKGADIWLPVRRQRARVLRILDAPSNSSDALVKDAALLKL